MKKWIWIGVVAVVVIFFYATYNGFVPIPVEPPVIKIVFISLLVSALF